jgi:hypothetical protein
MKFKKNHSSNLGTFWLKIEQFWPFEEISIFSNDSHLGYRTALTDTILKGDCKNVQHVKIYLPCNFEVNPITHFDRLCKLEKRGDEI